MHTDATRGVRNGRGCGGLSGRRAGGQRSTQGALVRLTGTHYLHVQTTSRALSYEMHSTLMMSTHREVNKGNVSGGMCWLTWLCDPGAPHWGDRCCARCRKSSVFLLTSLTVSEATHLPHTPHALLMVGARFPLHDGSHQFAEASSSSLRSEVYVRLEQLYGGDRGCGLWAPSSVQLAIPP
jgi:hypothetical protein